MARSSYREAGPRPPPERRRGPSSNARRRWLAPALALTAAVALAWGCARPAPPAAPASDTSALIARARTEERARRYDRARRLYERARDSAPDPASRAHATRALARALVFWGEYRDAEAELTAVVALAPRDAASWHDLGILRHHRGDLAGAEAALRRAVALAPRDGRPRIALAALLWKQRRLGDALAEYRALRALPLPARVRDKVAWAIRTLSAQVDE